MEEGQDTTEWIYVSEFRRFRGATHQLYKEGEWITISTLEDYIRDLNNKVKGIIKDER